MLTNMCFHDNKKQSKKTNNTNIKKKQIIKTKHKTQEKKVNVRNITSNTGKCKKNPLHCLYYHSKVKMVKKNKHKGKGQIQTKHPKKLFQQKQINKQTAIMISDNKPTMAIIVIILGYNILTYLFTSYQNFESLSIILILQEHSSS